LLGARWLCQQQSKFLNFDVTSFAVPPWVFLLVGVVGVLVPLLAAAWPVWKGTGISVREALADYGVTQTRFGTGRLERALINVGGVTRPVLLAVRNSFRRRTRLALTLLTLAAGGLFFMSALNVRASMIHTLDELFSTRKFDLQVSMGGMYPIEKVQRAVANTPGVRYAEAWFVTQAAFTPPAAAANDRGGHGSRSDRTGHGGAPGGALSFVVIALPSDSRMMQRRIVAGRDLQSEDVDAIVVNHNLAARHPEMQVGKTISFQMGPAETTWRVVGITREPFSPPLAYIPQSFIAARHPGSANALRLQVDRTDPASLNAIKASLDENLAKEGIRALGSMSQADSRFGFDQHMVMIYVFLIVTAGIVAGVGGLGLATTMSLNVIERRREMGVLRALGATPRLVWLIIVAEGTVTALLGWAFAGVLAWPVSKTLGDLILKLMFHTNLDFAFDVRGLAVWFVISIALGGVASFLPAWSAARRPVREAVAYE
jgi:putative ABC transport system permease protein